MGFPAKLKIAALSPRAATRRFGVCAMSMWNPWSIRANG